MKSYRENPEGEANTKRFLVPAFLLVEADDADHATEVAGEIASDVNSTLRAAADNDNHLLLDEEATNVEVQEDPSGEFPHTTPAVQACLALVTAYDAGRASGGEDFNTDEAHALALKAIGRLREFTVLYRDETIGQEAEPYKFVCRADDLAHAQEQCLNANEGCSIVQS